MLLKSLLNQDNIIETVIEVIKECIKNNSSNQFFKILANYLEYSDKIVIILEMLIKWGYINIRQHPQLCIFYYCSNNHIKMIKSQSYNEIIRLSLLKDAYAILKGTGMIESVNKQITDYNKSIELYKSLFPTIMCTGIDAIKTSIIIENKYSIKMNLVQFYIYHNNQLIIKKNSSLSDSQRIILAKCYRSYDYCLENKINDMYETY